MVAVCAALPVLRVSVFRSVCTKAECWNSNGKLEMVKLLIQAKASVYLARCTCLTALRLTALASCSWDGWTPLHFATWREKFAVARELIQADADVDVEGVDGRTAG